MLEFGHMSINFVTHIARNRVLACYLVECVVFFIY